MEITIYGENRHPSPYLFVHYAVEPRGEDKLIEIFRQCLPYMPRYEPGDVIKFDIAADQSKSEKRYVVDRVVNYIVCMNEEPKDISIPQFQNQIYVILRAQPLAEGSETFVQKLKGRFDLELERPGDPNSAINVSELQAKTRKYSRAKAAPQPDKKDVLHNEFKTGK